MSPQTSPETLAAIRGRVQAFDLRALFLEELGWDRARQTLPMTVDGAAGAASRPTAACGDSSPGTSSRQARSTVAASTRS
jgi:hypothetical protein